MLKCTFMPNTKLIIEAVQRRPKKTVKSGRNFHTFPSEGNLWERSQGWPGGGIPCGQAEGLSLVASCLKSGGP